MSIDRLLHSSTSSLTGAQVEKAEELAELDLISLSEQDYIYCVSEDDDYFDVMDYDCQAEIGLSNDPDTYINCPKCGRSICLSKKTKRTKIYADRNLDGIYRFIRNRAKSDLNASVTKIDDGVRFLDTYIEPALKIKDGQSSAKILLHTKPEDLRILDTIRLFNGKTISILIGSATTQSQEFESRNLTYTQLSSLLPLGDKSIDFVPLFEKATNITQDNPESLAEIGVKLYKQERDRFTWREFEHTVQWCLKYCYETSRLLGGEESGEQVPDGILSLDWGSDSEAYLWDAKYVQKPDDSRSISKDYEDMAKHLVQFRRESNVLDIFGDVSGFLIISPSVTSSSIARLAERIQQRLTEVGDNWNGAVVRLQFDALVSLFRYLQMNKFKIQEKDSEFRKQTHRLFCQTNYHEEEPEKFKESDHVVIDVSSEDIEKVFKNYIKYQQPEYDSINIEGYLANLRGIDF